MGMRVIRDGDALGGTEAPVTAVIPDIGEDETSWRTEYRYHRWNPMHLIRSFTY